MLRSIRPKRATSNPAAARRAKPKLRAAVAAGYLHFTHVLVDTDLDGHRSRPDFHLLIMALSILAAVDCFGCSPEASQELGPVPAPDGQDAVHSGAGS
jgi:hypothetical protein